MRLSKAFDCVPHDLLIAKLEAYGINENLLTYIDSYLSNRKQCARINNVTNGFETIISGVPQGSIVGPLLFNCFFSDFFHFIEKASVHNSADDNTLSMFVETIQNLYYLHFYNLKAILSMNGSKITKWWSTLASSKRLLLIKRRIAILKKLWKLEIKQ